MKKITNVSLGGMSFQVEDDAYARLDAYLREIRARFASMPEADEIIADIEARAAEQLQETHIVTLADVERLIATLGSPEQLGDEPEQPRNKSDHKPLKRLFRNPDDRIIAGVASGLAAWFGVDTKWVRLALIVAVLTGPLHVLGILSGVAVVGYGILWLTLPVARTEADKIEMRGEAVTLSSIEAAVRDRVQEAREEPDKANARYAQLGSRLAARIEAVARAVSAVFVTVVLAVMRVVGALIALAGVAVIAGALILGANVLINGIHPEIHVASPAIALADVLGGWTRWVGIAALALVIAVPGAFAFLLGMSIARKNARLPGRLALSLLGVFLVAATALSVVGVRVGGQVQQRLRGDAWREDARQAYDLRDFTRIAVGSGYSVTVTQGDAFSVSGEGSRAALQAANVSVNGGTLTIGGRSGDVMDSVHNGLCLFCATHEARFAVTVPDLESVKAQEGAYVRLDGIAGDTLALDASQSAGINARVDVGAAAVNASEGARVTFEGSVDNVAVTASMGASIDARDADVQAVAAELTSGSTAEFGSVDGDISVKARLGSSFTYEDARHVTRDLESGATAGRAGEERE